MRSNFGISVIIPNYNRAAFLKQAIESVLAQTYPVLEILICDDGSQDESRSVVQAFADHRIQWLDCGRNGRPAIPRNKGVQRAKGQWLAFLDNDD
ncbi:MAG: glycosyltransferase family 2 protein, partial [Sphingobacteriia bacterium]|nr:glycosyltransferase family 2 protein [Sphingobacteriia bacterium]